MENILFTMKSKIFLLLIFWRLSSVFIVQTSHVPDEYWQSVEVAHKLSFNYGYLTWEWQVGIRSYLYPFLISILFSLLEFLKIDYAFLVIYLPRIFQALLCAYAEYKFYTWTGSKFALLTLSINWYWYYCATRTLINTFETCLTIIALSEYPWKDNSKKSSKFLWIVGFLCFARPTAAVIWLPLCIHHLYKTRNIFSYLIIGLISLIISTSIDTLCYGRFIITPYEFFKVNILNRVSEQYGKNHFLWYFFSGLPVLLGLCYTCFPTAIYRNIKNRQNSLITFTIVWTLAIYSSLAHKEFRFILPVLPMIIYIINEAVFQKRFSDFKKKFFISLLLLSNVFPGFYFSVFHQQGSLKVMDYLRNEVENPKDILFLMTCHSTPYYSHLHKNVSMRFLTCEPNLENVKNYLDETDQFYLDPMKWLEINYMNKSSVNFPSHLITYAATVERVKPFIDNYTKLTGILDIPFIPHGKEFVIYKHLSVR